MIRYETVTIEEKNYIWAFSDEGFLIERDGVKYNEAIDPVGSNREYIEEVY